MCLFLESRKGRASTDESWDRMEGPLVMSKKVGGREPKKIGEVGGAASARSLVVSGASKVAANARPGPVVEGRGQ